MRRSLLAFCTDCGASIIQVERNSMPGDGGSTSVITGVAQSGRSVTASIGSGGEGAVATIIYGARE